MSQATETELEQSQFDDPAVHLSHPDVLYEVVDGQVVELPEMGAFAYLIANHLAKLLLHHLEGARIGGVLVEAMFLLHADRNLRRRPDVAFVSFDRWPADRPVPDEDWNVVPDLAVEVVSPNDRIDEQMRKIRDYFEHGVRLVWVLQPSLRQVYLYTSLTNVRVLDAGQELDGGEVLPGFRLPVELLFRRTLG